MSTIHLANPDEMRELPHYVQERIILIRARAPEVSFSIEKLVQDGWTLDPIVRARFKNEKRRLVIAIFDEKGKKVF